MRDSQIHPVLCAHNSLRCVLAGVLLMFVSGTHATTNVTRTIERIGCHGFDRICYVYVAGEPVGPHSSCESESFRWSADTHPNHNEIMSLLTAAFMADKPVSFTLNTECFSRQPTFPTIRYFNVAR